MTRIILFLSIFGLISCSSIDIKQKSQVQFDTLYFAYVKERKKITLEANESKAGRVMVGLISAGPVGAIATANTEEGFSEPTAFKYTLTQIANKENTVISRSFVEPGDCVEVVSTDSTEIELLIAVPEAKCAGGYNKHSQSDR